MAFPTHSATLVSSSTQFFSHATDATLSFSNSDFAVEMWVKITSAPASGTYYYLISKWNGVTQPREWRFFYHNNAGTLQLGCAISQNGTAGAEVALNQNLGTNTWHHVAFSYATASGTTTVIVDGASVGTIAADLGGPSGQDGDVNIGQKTGDPNTSILNGEINLVRLWKQSRTATQINTNKCTQLGSTASLQAEWTLDNVLTDNSGNSQTLTNNGSATFTTDVTSTCASGAVSLPFRALLGVGI